MKKYRASIRDIVNSIDEENNNKDSKEYINEINKKIDDGDYSDISTLVQKSVDTAIEGVRGSINYILNSYKNKKDLPPARTEKYAVQNGLAIRLCSQELLWCLVSLKNQLSQ